MAAEIITLSDFKEFKKDLLKEIKLLLNKHQTAEEKKWLKSPEVRSLLNISPGKLQNMRVNGTLPFTKIGGVVYYEYEEIRRLLEKKQK